MDVDTAFLVGLVVGLGIVLWSIWRAILRLVVFYGWSEGGDSKAPVGEKRMARLPENTYRESPKRYVR